MFLFPILLALFELSKHKEYLCATHKQDTLKGYHSFTSYLMIGGRPPLPPTVTSHITYNSLDLLKFKDGQF